MKIPNVYGILTGMSAEAADAKPAGMVPDELKFEPKS